MTPQEVLEYAKKNDALQLDLRFHGYTQPATPRVVSH